MLISVVIPNYNYEQYLGSAIDSALNLDWPSVEVIVVDDGSTDGSRVVIERYGDRVTPIYKRNGGQTDACNVGFAACHGEVVIFLDSDDVLDRSLIRELALVWRPGVSKVQCQMVIIDANGHPSGSILPQYRSRPTPAKLRRWVAAAGAYPTPPGSGNMYSRKLLEKIFPLDGVEPASDSYLLAAAPYLGDVVTISKPLAFYRIHGRNDGAMANLDPRRFGREVARAAWRFKYAQSIARSVGITVPDKVFNRSMTMLAYRIASLRLLPEEHPIAGDSCLKVLSDFARASIVPQGLVMSARIALLIWAMSISLLPRQACEMLVLWRFASSRRPARLRRLLTVLRVGR